MRYLKDTRTLILHVPRTGGSWIERAVGLLRIPASRWSRTGNRGTPKKHAPLQMLKPQNRMSVDYSAAFVRHPIQYYASVWKYLSTRGAAVSRGRWSWHPWRKQIELWQPDMTFDDWVWLTLRKDPQWYTRLLEVYIGPPGGELVDFVGRNEHLLADFARLLELRGYDVRRRVGELQQLGWVNATSGGVNWQDGLMAEVLDSERLAIERFYPEGWNE